MASSRRGPDQCWSWVISMSGFTINMLLSGISRAAGIFYFALINDYGASRREANLPFTIRNVVRNMAGLGVALANTLFQITINQYFEKYRATAAGLALSGACIGSFVLPIMLEAILSEYGLAGTFLLTGGLAMQVLPPSVILKEPPWLKNQQQPKNKKPKVVIDLVKMTSSADRIQILRASKRSWSDTYLRTEEDQSKALWEKQDFSSDSQLFQEAKTTSAGKSDISVLKIEVPDTIIPGKASMWKCLLRVYRNPMFHLISLSLAAYCISFDPLTTVIVDYAKDKGHDDYIGKYFISILALGDLVGRLCFGWVTDKKFLSVPHFLVVSYMLQGIGFALLPFVSSFEGLVGLLAVYGVTAGTGLIMFPILVANYLESEQSLAFGCIMFFSGLVSFVVPLLIGHFRDGVGSYDGMFFIIGGVCITTGLLWLLEPWVVKLMKLEKKSVFK